MALVRAITRRKEQVWLGFVDALFSTEVFLAAGEVAVIAIDRGPDR